MTTTIEVAWNVMTKVQLSIIHYYRRSFHSSTYESSIFPVGLFRLHRKLRPIGMITELMIYEHSSVCLHMYKPISIVMF